MISKKVIAIILGGGAGTRLHPLTATRSKPAVSIAGKYRLVDIPITNCLHSDIKRMFVLTQFNSASLNKHIKNTYHFSVFSDGFVDILAAEQTPLHSTWFQGTADAVRRCLVHIDPFDFDYILILSGDQLYQMDFAKMLDNHERNGAEITVATIPVAAKDASSFGIMKTGEEDAIASFIEKPKQELLPEWSSEVSEEMKAQGRIYQASMGIYVFNRNVLYDILNNTPDTDFGKEIIPHAIGNRKVISYQYDGYWTDIGTIPSFFEANIELTDDIPRFNLFDRRSIYTRPRMLPPSKISGTTLEKTVVSEGCIIQASRIERSVIGIRTRIGKGTTIASSYIMGSDFYETLEQIAADKEEGKPLMGVGERCYIRNAILDKNCRVGNDVRINGGTHLPDGDFETHTVREGIVVIKKAAIIPDGTVI